MKRFYFLVGLFLFFLAQKSFSQISLTAPTGNYVQEFNTLASSGSGNAWTNNLTLEGWFLFRQPVPGTALATYDASTGTSTAGSFYSYGLNAGDRALGGLGSGGAYFGSPATGNIAGWMAVSFTNNTGGTINEITIAFDGEQWRNGGNATPHTMVLEYGFGSSFSSVSSWTEPGGNFNWTSPVASSSAGAVDGNVAGKVSGRGGALNAINWINGSTLWVRWVERNDAGNDHGLAIDHFSLTYGGTVSDVTPPAISSLSPANGSVDIPLSTTASVNFSEVVQKGTGSITVRKLSDNTIVQTIDVSSAAVTLAGPTASFNLSGLATNTGYYIEIENSAFEDLAGNNFTGISGNGTWAFTTGNIFYVANFQTCTSLGDGFTQFSATGSVAWACTSFGRDPGAPAGTAPFPNGVQINGFAGGTNVPNVDWLISPSFDLSGTTYPLLSFWSRTTFNGLPLQLKVSTDYTGGDPGLATWTDINGKFPPEASNIWTLSSGINLSAFKAPNVHFAFVYTSTDEDGARWTLDDISLANSPTPPPASLTINTTDVQFTFVAGGSSAVKTFSFIGNDLTGDVTLNTAGTFELSKDGNTFSPSIVYSVNEANNVSQTVYVRFAPDQSNQDYTGTITIATSDISGLINLNGTSIDPATTLEVVNWNIEWFGSTSNGPTNDNLQQQNVRTVLQNVGADIYGLVEVVDETRLAGVVNDMPGYTYVIGNFGSHVTDAASLAEAQKLAFVYKTSVFSNVTVRPLINNQNTLSTSYNNWSSGRYPLLMTADVTLNCVKKKMHFILIHAKANTSPTATSYARRQAAANELYDSIQTYFAGENVIVLGDFNDDLDRTITSGINPPQTSYSLFTSDNTNFFSPTLTLSLAGKKSTVSHNDVIDHVVVSNEVQPYYMTSTATILSDVSSYVSNYGSSTSDHYPVFTRYRFELPASPVVTTCPVVPAFCANADGLYSIPDFIATSPCGSVSYSFEITGATSRNGNSNNASGSFEIGTSIITWIASDAAGNSVSCQTTVVVNPLPVVTIPDAYALSSGVLPNTVYIGYAPASSITLHSTVTGGSPDFSYSWSNGVQTASTTVNPGMATLYSVTVTDANGCQASAARAIAVLDIRAGKKMDKISICHSSNNRHSIQVDPSAAPAHLAHGDMLGSCEMINPAITGRTQPGAQVISEFKIRALPNPSAGYFTLSFPGGSNSENISVRITDIAGRTVEVKSNLSSGTSLRLGERYTPGIYFAEVKQGPVRQQIKLVKL